MDSRRRGDTMVATEVTTDARFSAAERAARSAGGARAAVTAALVELGRCLPKSKRSSRRSIGSNEHELENLGILDARTTSRSDLKDKQRTEHTLHPMGAKRAGLVATPGPATGTAHSKRHRSLDAVPP
jgi:hypothetical protein